MDHNNQKVLARILNLDYVNSAKSTERELKIAISYLAQELYIEQDNKGKGNFAFNEEIQLPLFRHDDTIDSCDVLLKVVECK